MGLLKMSGPVRRQLGEETARALDAGTGLPTEGQCWACGDGIGFFGMRPGSVSVSVVAVGTVSIMTWGHGHHAPSRVFTAQEYEQATRAAGTHPDQMASPIAPSEMDESLIVEGKRIL